MLIISKKGVQELKQKIEQGKDIEQCMEEIQHMMDIKDSHKWRADCAPCNCVGWELPIFLGWELQTLEDALSATREGNYAEAASMLESYIDRVQWQDYECPV